MKELCAYQWDATWYTWGKHWRKERDLPPESSPCHTLTTGICNGYVEGWYAGLCPRNGGLFHYIHVNSPPIPRQATGIGGRADLPTLTV